jgi:hypothetical protein
MKNILRNTYLSRPRYNRYLQAVGNDQKKAKKLYNANIRLSQAFHPVISQFEVAFRNAINNKLINHFTDVDWILNQKNGFMRHHSLSSSHYFLKTCVQKTERNLLRKSIPITSGKVISDQTFGFWVSLYLSHHYSLLSGQLIHVFPHKPSTETRASIYNKLDKIRDFRNRVNHCEPLCFTGNSIDCTEALEIKKMIYNLLDWMNPDLKSFFNRIDNIQSKVDNIIKI